MVRKRSAKYSSIARLRRGNVLSFRGALTEVSRSAIEDVYSRTDLNISMNSKMLNMGGHYSNGQEDIIDRVQWCYGA